TFGAMALITAALVLSLPRANFWMFLFLFLLLFTASGIGNGSTYRMIPAVFALSDEGKQASQVDSSRKAAAALGLISAIGAYGGFLIPQALGLSVSSTGAYTTAFIIFIAVYLLLMATAWFAYARSGTRFAQHGV
ncbi:MAG: MFS transporter, partial [Glutamicibacter sp.]